MQCWNSYCSPGYPDVSNGLLAILLDPPGCLDDGGMIGSSWRDDGMVGKGDRDDGGTLAAVSAYRLPLGYASGALLFTVTDYCLMSLT